MVLGASGSGAAAFFEAEGGGHRWQRIPPTEKRGRVHTSTVTVAVVPEAPRGYNIDLRDVDFEPFKGSGPGGQHKNKTESAIRAIHRPSGIQAICQDSRHQGQNRKRALEALRARLAASENERQAQAANSSRRAQIGSGMRGDKIRTYREQDNRVTDHRTGKKARLDAIRKGDWGKLK